MNLKLKQNTQALIKKSLRCLIANVVFLASLPAVSAVPFRNAFEQYDLINQQTKELNLSLLAKIQIIIDQNRFNMANYVPTNNLPINDSGEVIGRRILKHTLQNWLDQYEGQELSQNVSAGWIRQIESMNSSMATSVDRSGHKIDFRLRAIETTAEVTYTGVVKAVLSYDVNESEAALEVSKKMGEQTYAYSHIDNPSEVRDVVGVRWSF